MRDLMPSVEQSVALLDEPCTLVYLADWWEVLDEAREASRTSAERLRHVVEDDVGGVDSPSAQGGEGCW